MCYPRSTILEYKIVSDGKVYSVDRTVRHSAPWLTRHLVTYNSETPTEIADHLGLTNPLALSRLISMHVLNRMAEAEPERFDALERSGFKVVRYGDIIYQVFDRFGGHYMDVGASAKIAKGLVGKTRALCLLCNGNTDSVLYRFASSQTDCQHDIRKMDWNSRMGLN